MNRPKFPATIDPLVWVGPDDPAFVQSGLIHAAHIPKEASPVRPAPVVVMIHGWGGNETVTWVFKQTIPQGVAIVTPRAPFALDNDEGFIWFHNGEGQRLRPIPDTLETGLSKLQQFLGSLADLYPIDPERLIMLGFSQGGAMITTLLLTRPETRQTTLGVVLLAGALLQLPQVRPAPNLLAGLPVFIAHGIEDAIIPLRVAQQARQLYLELGAEVTYGEYPTGHKVNSQGMKDLTAWLAARLSEQAGD
jgi:phospholipase/carboxylesterase